MHGRAWCLQCGPNSSLRVWAGPELRSSNKFGSHSRFQLSLVTSLAPVWSQLWTVNTPIDAGKEYYQSNVYRIIWVHQGASSLNPALWGLLWRAFGGTAPQTLPSLEGSCGGLCKGQFPPRLDQGWSGADLGSQSPGLQRSVLRMGVGWYSDWGTHSPAWPTIYKYGSHVISHDNTTKKGKNHVMLCHMSHNPITYPNMGQIQGPMTRPGGPNHMTGQVTWSGVTCTAVTGLNKCMYFLDENILVNYIWSKRIMLSRAENCFNVVGEVTQDSAT